MPGQRMPGPRFFQDLLMEKGKIAEGKRWKQSLILKLSYLKFFSKLSCFTNNKTPQKINFYYSS